MSNRYPLWKYLLLAIVLAVGVIYALPNVFGEDPALQITGPEGGPPSEPVQQRIVEIIESQGIDVKSAGVREGQFLVRLYDTGAQLAAADEVALELGSGYTVALNLAPSTPDWLRALGAEPMYLGLDLRGGVHFLMQVDLAAARAQAVERYVDEFRAALRSERIRYGDIAATEAGVRVAFAGAQEREQAYQVLRQEYPQLEFGTDESGGQFWLVASLPEQQIREIEDFAVQQNITTLRNRVNELGVAEPVIQRQGRDQIVVQLPGVQDTARAKDILGATATLEFHLVNQSVPPHLVDPDTDAPPGSSVYPVRGGGHILLYEDTILTGEYITNAQSGIGRDTGAAEVNISLNDVGGDIFRRVTADHVGDQMAVVFIESQVEPRRVNGEIERVRTEVEEVINVATIQDVLGSQFRITGLDSSQEARDLSLLLRAGSLAAPILIVEERTVGPSLGQENIDQGFLAVVLGFLAVVVFMALYYRVFGLVANVALFANLVLLVSILSMLQATLTLPGIAGIVLTVGMAVDANVLIFERIREELRAGSSSQTAIEAGYGKAFSTIADANVTTLIAALVLFLFGTGPIKGFAVTLSIGIVTSMFTAIMGTRALVNLIYGGRRGVRLSI
jgi:preprotein translocase subunit SecD